jgi:AcrR family transcriptional regulator
VPVTHEPAFRRLPRVVRERQILDAAVHVFSEQGYHDASVDAIAAMAGISKPMVYAYVGTKEELFTACLHREGRRLIEALAAAGPRGLPPEESLSRGLRAFFIFVADQREGWRVLYRQARGQDPFAGVLAQIRTLVTDIVVSVIGRAHPGAPLHAAPFALVGAAEAVADWLVEHPEADPITVADDLMSVVWLGADAVLRGECWRSSTGETITS